MSDKKKIFISHISEEGELAIVIKKYLDRAFLGLMDIFVSSDKNSITIGDKWLNTVDEALKSSCAMLVLCSKASVPRPWVNFEAGAGWVKSIPVIPVCHTGMRPSDLPIPLNMLNGIEASDQVGLEKVLGLLATKLGSAVPSVDYTAMISEIKSLEIQYGVIYKARYNVDKIIKILPELRQIFVANPTKDEAFGQIDGITIDKLQEPLNELRSMGLIQWGKGQDRLVLGGPGAGHQFDVSIKILEAYTKIVDLVMK